MKEVVSNDVSRNNSNERLSQTSSAYNGQQRRPTYSNRSSPNVSQTSKNFENENPQRIENQRFSNAGRSKNRNAGDRGNNNFQPRVNRGSVSMDDGEDDFKAFMRQKREAAKVNVEEEEEEENLDSDKYDDDDEAVERKRSLSFDTRGEDDIEDEGEDSALSRSLQEAMMTMLFDHEDIEDVIRGGGTELFDEDMDEIEHLFSRAFVEAAKSPNKTFYEVGELPSFRRAQIPQARTMRQLQAFMQPDVRSVPSDTPGYELAERAWGVS